MRCGGGSDGGGDGSSDGGGGSDGGGTTVKTDIWSSLGHGYGYYRKINTM